jgi:Tfp pilus assembly pilus retraction ATPase PilT
MTFAPTRDQINNIVKKFVNIEKIEEGSIFEFSFFVIGLGVFRVSYSFDDVGVGIAIRYLTFTIPNLSLVGYPKFYEKFIKDMISTSSVKTSKGVFAAGTIKSGGLILHVGTTGSGKTTSIAAELGHFAENINGAVATYENPIEYRYTATKAPIRQYEIGKDIKKTEELSAFANIKRHLLRNNPSLVMIGEARDTAEIKEMLDTAARGHLVLSTTHASNVMEALTTLISASKDEPHVLANTLHAIVAHKLLTNKRGEIVPIYEILIPDEVIKTHLAKGDIMAIKSVFQKENITKNSITFSESLTQAARDGKFLPDEVREIISSSYGIFSKKENEEN